MDSTTIGAQMQTENNNFWKNEQNPPSKDDHS